MLSPDAEGAAPVAPGRCSPGLWRGACSRAATLFSPRLPSGHTEISTVLELDNAGQIFAQHVLSRRFVDPELEAAYMQVAYFARRSALRIVGILMFFAELVLFVDGAAKKSKAEQGSTVASSNLEQFYIPALVLVPVVGFTLTRHYNARTFSPFFIVMGVLLMGVHGARRALALEPARARRARRRARA